MTMHNLPNAQAQYDDMRGSIAIDLQDAQESLLWLASRAGINLSHHKPVGIDVLWQGGSLEAQLLVIPTQAQQPPIPVARWPLPITLPDLLRILSCVSITVYDSRIDLAALQAASQES